MFNLRHNRWIHFLSIAFIGGLLAFHFFFISKYASYPWWHQMGNDIDGTHAATTVGLLNNSEFTFVYHPAATLFQTHGIVYRLLALAGDDHKRLLHLSEVKNYEEALAILETATHTSRLFVLVVTIAFVALLYTVIYQMTKRAWLAFFFSFYIMISSAHLQHTTMIRAEIFNLFFFLAAVLLTLINCQKRCFTVKEWMGWFVGIGFLLAFSVYSKIQIGPAVLLYLLTMFITIFLMNRKKDLINVGQKSYSVGLILSMVNMVIFPWWVFKKPDFLTEDYFGRLSHYSDLWKVYGGAPESFVLFPILILVSLFVLSGLMVIGQQKNMAENLRKNILPFTLFFQSIIMGFSLSVYLILLPVSVTLSRYIENTQHLIYAVITNVFYGGFLTNRIIDGGTWEKIFRRLDSLNILNVNLAYIILCALILSCLRLYLKSTKHRYQYLLVMAWFLLGLSTDILGTMRHTKFYSYYTIYSATFYGLGLAQWIALELSQFKGGAKSNKRLQILRSIIIIIFSLHIFFRCQYILALPKATGESSQTPQQELINTQSHAQPFWDIVDRGLEKQGSQRRYIKDIVEKLMIDQR